jgi:DNA repair exonuclease SbcCD ATPase subunit
LAVIKNIIQTTFTSTGSEAVNRQTQSITKAQTRLAQSSASAGRSFAAQSQGLGGLVGAYAGAAATTFALQQAFDALARSARASQTLDGLRSLAESAGQSSQALLNTVREVTNNQLTLTEAAQQINLSLSAGFSTEQIERLGKVALSASRALGRDLTDAYTRVIRGSAKLETELLDELGIYTRIDPAVRAYAAATNKVAANLTDFERRQAFVNAVIAEGERKFRSINTTIPTTSEKIEAFGTSIIDAATKIGIFFAEAIAPLAEFLTNNLAGSFGAVGLAASLVASKGVDILRSSIDTLTERAEARSQKINTFFLSLNKGSREAQEQARAAIAGLSLARSGLVGGIGTELKALKDLSAARTLTTNELKQATVALEKRQAALVSKVKTEEEAIGAQRALLQASKLTKTELEAATKNLDMYEKRLDSTNKTLQSTQNQLTAVAAAANRSSASLASFVSGVVAFGGRAITTSLALGASFISLAGNLIGAVSVVSLLGVAIANLIGKQEEYNALLEKFGTFIRGFFTPSEVDQARKGFTSLADGAINDLSKIDSKLKEIEKFKFTSKIAFVTVEIEKTKQQLSKEVGSALAEVARASSKTFGENLATASTGIGLAAGAIIGAGIGTALGSLGGPIGTAVGAKLGSKIGVVASAAIGGALTATFNTFFNEELPKLTAERERELSALIGDSTAFSGESGDALSRAARILDDQLGIASSLSLEAREYLRIQIETVRAIVENRDNILELQTVAELLSTTADEVRRKFGATSSEIEGIDGVKLRATLRGVTRDLDVGFSITLINEQTFLSDLDNLTSIVERELTAATSIPIRRGFFGGEIEVSFERALESATNRVDAARTAVDSLSSSLSESNSSIAATTEQLFNSARAITLPESASDAAVDALGAVQVALFNLTGNQTTENVNAARAALSAFLTTTAGSRRAFRESREEVSGIRGVFNSLVRELQLSEGATNRLTDAQEQLSVAQANLNNLFRPDQEYIDYITQTLPRGLEQVANSLKQAGLTSINFSNIYDGLIREAESASLSLDGFTQTSQSLATSLDRTSTSVRAAEAGLAALKAQRDNLRAAEDRDPESLREVNELIGQQERLLAERREALEISKQQFSALGDQLAPILEQLELTEVLRRNFGSLLTQNNNLLGLFNAQGEVIANSEERERSRFDFLQRTYAEGEASYRERIAFEKQINDIGSLDIVTKQALLGATAETVEALLEQLTLTEDESNALKNILFLRSAETIQARETGNVLTIIASQYINQITALSEITEEINKQNTALQQRIGILQAQNAVAAAQRDLDRVRLNNSTAQNRAQLDIRESQAELTKLQIAQNAAGGDGLATTKASLELLKSEIALRQTISDIEAETIERRLQANLDAAEKTKEAFAEVTSVLDLTGALTGIGAILGTQLELIELERQQAEEKYQNTLETLAIERQLLEAEMSAASGAQRASEEVIAKQLEILRAEQALEQQALVNTRLELRERLKLLEAQQVLQIAEAQAEAAKARADVAALRTQGEQNIAFLRNKTELDQEFLDNFAAIISEFIKASDPTAATITAGQIATNLDTATASFETVISNLEASNNTLFGTLDDAGNTIGGLVFEELERSFESSKAAIQAEINALNEREMTLIRVQELERLNAEAQLRAQQGGGAARLAELQAQLNAIEAQEREAGAERARIVAESSKRQAEAIRTFANDVIATIEKFVTAQKQARINALLAEEAQLKDILEFQTQALNEAQSAASDALREEISLREELKAATESLIESQNSYLESLGGDGSIKDASKQFIDTLLDQKQAIFDLQRATRSRIAADGRVASLESVKAQLQDDLSLKTAQRIEAESDLEKIQQRLALVTKLVNGEIGNFIKSLGSLGSSLSGLGGGGSFGQVFSNLLGFQDALSSFASIGNTFATASGRQLAAANTQVQAAAAINNAASTLAPATSLRPVARPDSLVAGAAGATAGTTGAASGLTFSALANTAFAGAGIGSLIGSLTGDVSWASTIGGAVGSTLATVFAGSKFVGAVTAGITKVASTLAPATASSIALIATPLVFAAIGALLIGAIFGRRKPTPQARISGTVTDEGFETTSVSSRDLSRANVRALQSIPQQVFGELLSSFEAAGLNFKDSIAVNIRFYKDSFKTIETTFASGITTTASNIGKKAEDAAKELERQFFRGLGATSFEVDQFTPSRDRIQQALRAFGEIQDLDQKTRERFIEGLTFAQEFDSIVRRFLATSADIDDIFSTIDFAARSFTESKLNEYLSELDRTANFLGAQSAELNILRKAIRVNALSLLGLAEAADGSLVSTRELTSELNAGAIAIRNIVAETSALRTTLLGLGSIFQDIDIDATINQAIQTRIGEFVNDFASSIGLAIDILREPARIVLVDLEKFIVNGNERIKQALGVYNQLITEQASGLVISSDIIATSYSTIEKSIELLDLELKGFISTISDRAQLQAIINGAEAIDSYSGAVAKSAAQARLAEINEIERTQATQQFNKISREFSRRLREIIGVASGLSIGGEGVSFIEVLEAFGTTSIDESARQFKNYLDLINAGSDITSNFNSAIEFLNNRFDNGETDSLKFVSSLELLQRVTLETVNSIAELTDAYENSLQQISDAFNSARSALVDSVKGLGDELVRLIKAVSDQTQEILSIYDNAVKSFADTGNAIFDLRDAANDAFTSAADAVAEFEKANRLSGRSSSQVREELERVSAQIAETLGSQNFGLGSFIELSGLTSQQNALQRELKRLGIVESEYETLLKTRTQASEDLAFVESSIANLSDTLTDSRSKESKVIQDTRAAVEQFTNAQITLNEVTATLAENNFNLTQTRIDETSAIVRLNNALRELNRSSTNLDTIVGDIVLSSDSTLRSAFIDGAIANIASELSTLDETARAVRIAEVTTAASSAFDSLIPLIASIKDFANPETVKNILALSDVTTLTTDTFETLLGVFNANAINPVQALVNEVNRFSAIGSEIANVNTFSAGLLNLGAQTETTAADVALLVSDLNALENQLQALTSGSGVDSLRETFKGLAQDLQKAWDENVVLGLPDVINLSAISVAPDGGLNELKQIALNSNKYAYIRAVGAQGMEQAVFRAEGGYISGPGTSTSDSIPAQLSNGEYVIKASTVKKLGLSVLNDLNSTGDLDAVIASKGRFGDTIGAHINLAEAELLKKLGGSGTRNPVTGMLEFFGGSSSGAQAYGGLFSAEEAKYIEKIQKALPRGNASLQDSNKVNWMDTRKLRNTFVNTVGNPISLRGSKGNDIMSTDSYNAMQNQMLASTMIMDTLASKRGLPGIESQTQGFGIGDRKASKKSLDKLVATGDLLSKDVNTIFKDLLDGSSNSTASSVNKVLTNGNTILSDQSDLNSRYDNILNKMLGSNVNANQASSIVDEYNKKNGMFFDFYMLQDAKIPAYQKADYYAKNNSTGGLVKSLNAASSVSGANISGQRDSIPSMLEPGEFVLRKAAVERMGLDTAIRLNSTGNAESDVNVEVNVINNGSPVTPTVQQARKQNGKIIVDVILEDVRNNGPIRQAMRGIK